jgi:hypothetical protein
MGRFPAGRSAVNGPNTVQGAGTLDEQGVQRGGTTGRFLGTGTVPPTFPSPCW